MQMNNNIKFANWQASEIKNGFFSVMAGARLAFESARRHRAARAIGWAILAALSLILTALISFRVAQAQQQRRFEEWQERFVNEYLAQQEAAEIGFPPDPKEELEKQENMEFAKLCAGLWRYQYGYGPLRTLGELVKLRVMNPTKPNTIVEVIQEPGQWPGYSPDNEVTAEGYRQAAQIMDEVRAEEFPLCGSDMILASFGKDKIVLRNSMEYGPNTETWWYGKNGEGMQ